MQAEIRRAVRSAFLGWGVMAIMVSQGCGPTPDAGTVQVTGEFSVDGRPLEGATVAFIGGGGARLATAQTDRAGKFTLRAAPGPNEITVAKGVPVDPAAFAATDDNMEMPMESELLKRPPPPTSEVPTRYNNPKTSGLSIEVSEGMPQPVSFSISSQ